MARRSVLTARQQAALFDLPTDEAIMFRHYVLNDEDLVHIRRRRRARNRLGFALQLCAFRYPGRLLQPAELIPNEMLAFVGGQLGLTPADLADYAVRSETRYEHSSALQRIFGYQPFEGAARTKMTQCLVDMAVNAHSNEALVVAMLGELRRRRIIVPAVSTVERACADALVAAERQIVETITERLDQGVRDRLMAMLQDTVEAGVSRFAWLRRHEAGSNSADANQLLDQFEWIEELNVPAQCLDGVAPHRIARLRRQGERYFADGLRDLPERRRLAILAVCAIKWRASLADAVVETHDRIVGKLYRAAERMRDRRIADQKADVAATLRSFAHIGETMVAAREGGDDLSTVIDHALGWEELERLTRTAHALTGTMTADPLDHVGMGYARFRRYAPRMLEVLKFQGGRSAEPLLTAIDALKEQNRRASSALPVAPPVAFARPKWRKRLGAIANGGRRMWETAILFTLRDALRSGDVWLTHSHRHRKFGADLVPIAVLRQMPQLTVPLNAADWIQSRKAMLDAAMTDVGKAAEKGSLPLGAIEDGTLRIERLEREGPDGTDDLVLRIYRAMPQTRITDVLIDVDAATGFTDAFADLRTGSPCRDLIGLLSVILADGINLGLKKMAASTNTHTHWQLLRVARWHVENEAYERALAMVVDAQARLPMARLWGEGRTASSDGQFFPAGGVGEAMNLVNARYGNTPGIKAYSHVSDQFAPFAVKTIPATAHEAPFILDGLVGCDAGRRVDEHYADTGGFTDHVFALASILGYAFTPRIRDLPQKRLYAFEPANAPHALRPLIAARVRTDLIERNWPDILRLAASIAVGAVVPSAILRKLAAYPRQNELAVALREVGRLERSLFMLRWICDEPMQRRAQLGLNKGEAHHALKRAINFNRRGEIRDRTAEGQHHRMAALNLLTAIIVHWNTQKIGDIVTELTASGRPFDLALLAHVSPLGWEHINLNGQYQWPALA